MRSPAVDEDKRCFAYCGDDRCNCAARGFDDLNGLKAAKAADRELFERVERSGGIWGFSPKSDRIGP